MGKKKRKGKYDEIPLYEIRRAPPSRQMSREMLINEEENKVLYVKTNSRTRENVSMCVVEVESVLVFT
jgi:hypothetical protein